MLRNPLERHSDGGMRIATSSPNVKNVKVLARHYIESADLYVVVPSRPPVIDMFDFGPNPTLRSLVPEWPGTGSHSFLGNVDSED